MRTAVIDHLRLRYLQGRTPNPKDLSLRQGDRADAGARPFLTLIRSAAASGSSHAIHPSARVPGALLKGCAIYSQRSQVYSSALQAAWSRRYSGGAKGRFPARIGVGYSGCCMWTSEKSTSTHSGE
jgi:hypothetical protein